MRRSVSILSLTVLLAGCSDGTPLRPPFLVLAPTPRDPVTPPALMAADVVGEWRVTASYQGRSYIDDFSWPANTSPFHLTIGDTRVRLDTPCRMCEAVASFSPNVLALGTLDYVPKTCQTDPLVTLPTDAIVYNLYGAMSMHRGTVAPATPRQLALASSRGSIDIESWNR